MTMKFGPWIRHDGAVRPSGLRDDQMIEAVSINNVGVLNTDSYSRSAGGHLWEGTLAYRVEHVVTTEVMFGCVGGGFASSKWDVDTHKITYTVNRDGDVISCKMEKL